MVLKISNNLVTWVELAIALQAFQLANAGGVASEKLITVMKRNGNLSSAMEALVRGSFGVTAPDQRKAFMESQGRIGEKDLDLAIGLAAAFGVEVPTAAQVREIVLKSMISA